MLPFGLEDNKTALLFLSFQFQGRFSSVQPVSPAFECWRIYRHNWPQITNSKETEATCPDQKQVLQEDWEGNKENERTADSSLVEWINVCLESFAVLLHIF